MGMEKTTNPLEIKSFRGLNTKFKDMGIAPREATSLLNVNLNLKRLNTRDGAQIFTTSQCIEGGVAKPVTGSYQCVLNGTVFRVMTAGTKVYSLTAGGAKTDITGAAVITDNQDNIFSFATFLDSTLTPIIIIANRVNPVLKWTGAGNVAALSGTPGNFGNPIVWNNRLWGLIDDGFYHSDTLNGESWDSFFFFQRIMTSGFNTSKIVGWTPYNRMLAIFKEDGIFLFSGQSIPYGSLDQVVFGDGAMAGSSIVEIQSARYGNMLAFINRNGLLKGFNGTPNLIPLGEHVDETLKGYNSSRVPYITAVKYENLNQYICTHTSGSGGSKHDKLLAHDYYLDGIDQQDPNRESTMMIHGGMNINHLTLMDFSGTTLPVAGTYDGWLMKLATGSKDITKAFEIAAAPTGCVRASNVVTITTLATHNIAIGDTVIISGTSGGFDGTFTVATTPTGTSFTYTQTGSDTTGGAGIARVEAAIASHWQSRKEDFNAASHIKQINDFNIVCSNPASGSVQVDLTTDKSQATGQKAIALPPAATIYGPPSIYGLVKYGGNGLSYNRVVFTTPSGAEGLLSRHFQWRLSGVNGFKMGIDELVVGITDHGYQPQNVDTA